MSSGYLLLILVSTIIGAGAQAYVNRQINKYQHVATSTGLTGAAAAQSMLSRYGIGNVPVQQGKSGQDYSTPRLIRLLLTPMPMAAIPSPPWQRLAMKWVMRANMPKVIP